MTEGLDKALIEKLAKQCLRSPVEFCRVLLPDWFPTFMPWVHRGILAILQNKTDFLLDFGTEQWRDAQGEWNVAGLKKILTNFIEEGTGKPIFTLVHDPEPRIVMDVKSSVCIIMPRGSSKTTLVNASNLMDIEFKNEDFFLYVSEAAAHAERQLATVKGELEDNDGVPNNDLLYAVFGSHAPSRQSPLKWTENYIETTKGVMVGAVGRGGQIRGFGKRAKRPGKLMFDDIEDEESVQSEQQRKKNNSWFWNAARPAKKKGGRDIVTGTLLHTDAILNKCIISSEFTTVRFGAIDRQGDALWEWYMTLEDIAKKKAAMTEVGEVTGFYLEYMSEYRDDEARMFPESKLIYIQRSLSEFVAVSMAMDPAISEAGTAAMCAYGVVGTDRRGQKHVLESYGQKGMDPFDQIKMYFDLHFKWIAHLPPEMQRHGIEAMAYQRALIPMIRQAQVQYSKQYGPSSYFEVLPIFHGKIAKEARVQGILKPLIWSGHLTFNERYEPLHTQLIDWPSGLKDIPDVVAMAVALLDPYVILGLGDDGIEDLTKDTAPPLDVALGGSYYGAP